MHKVSSLICANETGTGELLSPLLLDISRVFVGAEGFNVPYFTTTVACGSLVPFLLNRRASQPTWAAGPEGRFGVGFGLHCSSSHSHACQVMAVLPVLPHWEHTSLCALTLLITCPAFSVAKYSVYNVSCLPLCQHSCQGICHPCC